MDVNSSISRSRVKAPGRRNLAGISYNGWNEVKHREGEHCCPYCFPSCILRSERVQPRLVGDAGENRSEGRILLVLLFSCHVRKRPGESCFCHLGEGHSTGRAGGRRTCAAQPLGGKCAAAVPYSAYSEFTVLTVPAQPPAGAGPPSPPEPASRLPTVGLVGVLARALSLQTSH